jgi:delta 1-pyrroline-5-carboxylate dehydrogenase
VPKTIPTLKNAPTPSLRIRWRPRRNGFVFVSGQVAIDPAGGPTPTDIEDQADLVLRNIGRSSGTGSRLRDVVKTTVFLLGRDLRALADAARAPSRGVRAALGNALRENRDELGALVSLEMGKILPEGVGEVQEMIDICDFAVGCPASCTGDHGLGASQHRMYEQWHPLGPVGVISAFNFPVAVWSWNSTIAAVCGDTNVWKPSERTPLTAIAVTRIAAEVMEGSGFEGVFNLAVGPGTRRPAHDRGPTRLPLISATGSCRMGKIVGPAVAADGTIDPRAGRQQRHHRDGRRRSRSRRAGRLFAAVGTAGQRCTSLRRLIVHEASPTRGRPARRGLPDRCRSATPWRRAR